MILSSILERPAIFSADRRYRYTLLRRKPLEFCNPGPDSAVMFIGLNPSTADETKNDPTIRRCMDFAERWGHNILLMTNLFAFRETIPALMRAQPHPIGKDNDHWLVVCARNSKRIVAAWGKDGRFMARDVEVCKLLCGPAVLGIECLGVNKDGTPKHPLYLAKTTMPIAYDFAG